MLGWGGVVPRPISSSIDFYLLLLTMYARFFICDCNCNCSQNYC